MEARASVFSVARLRGDCFPWVLALVTGLDYFDNTIFSFFASYIAGGVNASPDELVCASSAYAVGAVLGILQQQWWVDRLGHRRYIAGCMLLYAVGAVLSALTESSLQLVFTRGLQGYFVGPMMGACRILIQASFTPQKRAGATRAFLIMIVGSSAFAPLAGGWLLAHFDWRALFACTAPVGIAFGGLALLALPNSGNVLREARGATNFWPYLLFAFAQGALQIVMQQVRFELFKYIAHTRVPDLRRRDRADLVRLASMASSVPARAAACAARAQFSRSVSCCTCSITSSRLASVS